MSSFMNSKAVVLILLGVKPLFKIWWKLLWVFRKIQMCTQESLCIYFQRFRDSLNLMNPYKSYAYLRGIWLRQKSTCSNCALANQWRDLEKVFQHLQIKYSYSHLKIRGLQQIISKIPFNSNSIILTSKLYNKQILLTNQYQ